MTAVVLLKAGPDTVGYKVMGHAGYDVAGKDIVCAAISALSIACANGLEEVARIPVQSCQRDGYLSVRCARRHLNEGARAILATFRLGVQSICADYPGHVTVTEREIKPEEKEND